MITDERKAELEYWHGEETNEEESQEWRDDLTFEELEYVEQLDEQYAKVMRKLAKEIVRRIEDRTE